ncbi:SDR family oxidoreductase [Kutzneria viridogrisea]|uniref:SDR family oxidoreductase n=1 Tax=Kutzneria viridogrisea TaxID=47990 RepID=UPI0031F87F20
MGLTSGGELGFLGEVSYGAAKAALEHFTLSSAAELGPHGVTANLVHPPVTDTGWGTDEVRAHVAASSALFTVAQPEEVARVVAFLASTAARSVTGNTVRMR